MGRQQNTSGTTPPTTTTTHTHHMLSSPTTKRGEQMASTGTWRSHHRLYLAAACLHPHTWPSLSTFVIALLLTGLTPAPGKLPASGFAHLQGAGRPISACLLIRHRIYLGQQISVPDRGSWVVILSWQCSRVAENRKHLMGLVAGPLRCDWTWKDKDCFGNDIIRAWVGSQLQFQKARHLLLAAIRWPCDILWPWVKFRRSF